MTERYSDNNELGSNPIDKGLDGVVKPDESNLPESGQDNISGGSKPVDEEIRILEDKIVDVSVVKK